MNLHPFMTGSGGWSYFAATRYILGVRPQFGGLLVAPCVPAEWRRFEITRVWRGTAYHITVENPEGVVFTLNATHALNLAIKSLVPPGGRVVISGYEHNAVTRPLAALGAEIRVTSASAEAENSLILLCMAAMEASSPSAPE